MALDQLAEHKEAVRRFLEEERDADRVTEYPELCTADYVEHDPAMPQETVDLDGAREVYGGVATAFALRHTVESLVAENDLVAARFTVRGRHIGEYQGIAPSGRTFESAGQATFRFRDGKIAESWFNWDFRGMQEQLRPDYATPS
ncbi:ester cyclase [Streptomyces albus]|uniref:ester cyclase n=1 Tax=Streptomyces albus TaxID=1888 RepID=UPI0033C47B06